MQILHLTHKFAKDYTKLPRVLSEISGNIFDAFRDSAYLCFAYKFKAYDNAHWMLKKDFFFHLIVTREKNEDKAKIIQLTTPNVSFVI